VDTAELESTLTGSLDQIRAKIPNFVKSFAEFHAVLTSEQRSEIVEKMEKRLEHSEKRGWGRKWWKHWH
jgi:Spy/CpxP family protein refolding chaperone